MIHLAAYPVHDGRPSWGKEYYHRYVSLSVEGFKRLFGEPPKYVVCTYRSGADYFRDCFAADRIPPFGQCNVCVYENYSKFLTHQECPVYHVEWRTGDRVDAKQKSE